jgi:hypothetical protein
MGDGVAAINRPAIDETPLLENGRQKIRINLGPRNMRLGLCAHVGRERCRIVAEAQIGRDAQIERDRRFRLRSSGRWRRSPNEITAAIEQAERAGGEALERNVLQGCGPLAAIGRGQGDARDGRCIRRQAEEQGGPEDESHRQGE